MSKWARVENNEVKEIITFDPNGRFPEDWVWIPCSDEVTDHWTYDGSTFHPYPTPIDVPTPELPEELIGSEADPNRPK